MNSRRDFLKTLCAAAGWYAFQEVCCARDLFAAVKPSRVLNLYNIHTDERLHVKYGTKGIVRHDDLKKINHFMRCHYTGKIKPIPPQLINLLCSIKDRLSPAQEIHVISGYRSPEYNEYLRLTGHHVAKESMHLYGLAVDFSIPGVRTKQISRVAKRLNAGGVGKYSDFVHVDLGRVRYW